jgi:murein hydrolase activator
MIRCAMALVLWAGGACAQTETAAAAQAAAARLAAASVLLEQAGGSNDQIAALTEVVRAYEDGLGAMRDGLRRVAIRQSAIQAELDARSAEVSDLLGVLMTMGRAPAPLLLLHPLGPLGTARSGMIVSDVTPALQVRVDALRADLEEVAELRTVQDGAARTLQDGLDGAQTARAALAQAVSDRTDLPRRFTEDAVATALLIASTETLDAFANGLAGTVDGDTGAQPDATALRGTLLLPVQGQILRRTGEPDAAGIVRPGWVIATRPGALVTAPAAATIRYKGPLLDYGIVIILEPATDILIVIAGLADAFGEAGQVVPFGAPIGMMGGDMPAVDAILTESTTGVLSPRSETLYLEVRDGQGPVDPATWFAVE